MSLRYLKGCSPGGTLLDAEVFLSPACCITAGEILRYPLRSSCDYIHGAFGSRVTLAVTCKACLSLQPKELVVVPYLWHSWGVA